MRLGFVLTMHQQGAGWARTIRMQETPGAEAELTPRLRPWALEVIRTERCGNGQYLAHLVELDDDGGFDTYLALTVEDVIWYYEKEYVPA